MRHYVQRNSHRFLKAFGILLGFLLVLGAIWLLINRQGMVITTNDNQQAKSVVRASSRVLNSGSFAWASSTTTRDFSTAALDGFVDQDNVWIAHFACDVSSGTGCNPELLSRIRQRVGIVGVSGVQASAADSIPTKLLEDLNYQYFGSYVGIQQPKPCGVVSMPATLTDGSGGVSDGSLPLVLCTYDGAELAELTKSIATHSEYLPVWVYTYDNVPVDEKVLSTYRGFIDAGADMVVGVGRADVGSAEAYKGRLISTSLGAFVGPTVTLNKNINTASIRVDLSTPINERVQKWLEIARTCSGYSDLCLEAGVSADLPKLGYAYQYQLVGGILDGGYDPKLANELQLKDLKALLSWDKVISNLDQTGQTE